MEELDDDRPSKVILIDPSNWRFWGWILGHLLVFVTLAYSLMSSVASTTFRTEMDKFHRDAIPAIEQLIDTKVQISTAGVTLLLGDRIHSLESAAAARNERLEAVKAQQQQIQDSLKEVNRKLDVLLKAK